MTGRGRRGTDFNDSEGKECKGQNNAEMVIELTVRFEYLCMWMYKLDFEDDVILD